MLSIFRRLMKNEQGATAIEYVLIASLSARPASNNFYQCYKLCIVPVPLRTTLQSSSSGMKLMLSFLRRFRGDQRGNVHRIRVDRLFDRHHGDRSDDDPRSHAPEPLRACSRDAAMMSGFIAFIQRLVANQRGAMYVEYSSLLLLFVIAAIAVLTDQGGFVPK
jgi:Flp pilus assembly pilin Flp